MKLDNLLLLIKGSVQEGLDVFRCVRGEGIQCRTGDPEARGGRIMVTLERKRRR